MSRESGWRHRPIDVEGSSWAQLDDNAATVSVAAGEVERWRRQAAAGTEHSVVRVIEDRWDGPEAIEAGGLLVDEPCCEGYSFAWSRWETRDHPVEWGWRCGGCKMDVTPDVWLRVEISAESRRFDNRGHFLGCALPDPEAFAEAAERGWATSVRRHHARARQQALDLMDRVRPAVRADPGGVDVGLERISFQSGTVRSPSTRPLEPVVALSAEPGVLRFGWWCLADLGEQMQWVRGGVFVAAEPDTTAARLYEIARKTSSERPAERNPASIEELWDGVLEGSTPHWLVNDRVAALVAADNAVQRSPQRRNPARRRPMSL